MESSNFIWVECINRKRILEVSLMKKMLKIIGMLIVIAVVVFSAGCATKKTETTNTTTETSNATNLSTGSGHQTPVTTEVPSGSATTESKIVTNTTTTK